MLLNILAVAQVKPLIPALEKTEQEDYQFEASLSYIMNSRPICAYQDSISTPLPPQKDLYLSA